MPCAHLDGTELRDHRLKLAQLLVLDHKRLLLGVERLCGGTKLLQQQLLSTSGRSSDQHLHSRITVRLARANVPDSVRSGSPSEKSWYPLHRQTLEGHPAVASR